MKTKVITTLKNPYREFKKTGLNFEMSVGKTTTTFKIKDKKVIFAPDFGRFSNKAFSIFSSVKSAARKFEENAEIVEGAIHYNEYYDYKEFYASGFGVDIKSAYFREAYNIGIIDKKTFDMYNSKDKKLKIARNASIGNLYSQRDIFFCNSESDYYAGKTERIAPKTYRVVCNNVAILMGEIANLGQPVFYWVDNVFFSEKPDLQRIQKLAKSFGHEITYEDVTILTKKNFYEINNNIEKKIFPIKIYSK